MSTISPFARPVYVMLKPAGSICNLACEYCYYLEKGKLYPEEKNTILSERHIFNCVFLSIESVRSVGITGFFADTIYFAVIDLFLSNLCLKK